MPGIVLGASPETAQQDQRSSPLHRNVKSHSSTFLSSPNILSTKVMNSDLVLVFSDKVLFSPEFSKWVFFHSTFYLCSALMKNVRLMVLRTKVVPTDDSVS